MVLQPRDAAIREQTHSSQSSVQRTRPNQASPVVSHFAVKQPRAAMRPPVRYNPRGNYDRGRGRGGVISNTRYRSQAAIESSTPRVSVKRSGSGTGQPSLPSGQVIKTLEVAAKDLARECIDQGAHVDSARISQALLSQRKVNNFKDLGLRSHRDIPYIKELERLQRKVYETITAYCQVRATSTLYELGKYLAQMEERENFEDLGLGPLLDQPPVYQFFKPRRTLVAVPEITTRDVLGYLRSYMDTKYKWRGRIDFRDFLRFMTKERGCADPYELCVRVPTIGLPISVLRKAQRREKEEWRSIREEIVKEATAQMENNLRMTMEQLLGNTGNTMKHTEKCRIEEIAGQPAEKVVRHAFMFLSHRDMFPPNVNDAMTAFFDYVASNRFARKLFQMAICKGSVEDIDDPTDEQLAEEEEDADHEQSPAGDDDDEEYDIDWHRKHHRKFVPEGEIVEDVCKRLTEMDDLNLPGLAQIESHTATKFEAPEFTDLGHKSFLHFITYNSTILKVLDSWSSKFSLQSEQRRLSNQVSWVSKEHVFDVLQQCDLTRSKVALCQTLCNHFAIPRVEDLCLGPMDRVIQRARTHVGVRPVVSPAGRTFPRIAYQSAIVCGASGAANTQGAGILGWQTSERALQCLLSCPVLGDLAKYSHWNDVFAPSQGSVRDFISDKAGSSQLCALEFEPGVYLRVEPECSLEAFAEATAKGDARNAAGQLVSLLIQGGNVAAAPLALMATHMRSSLEQLAASVDVTKDSFEEVGHESFLGGREDSHKRRVIEFALQLLILIPYKLAVAISQQVVLEPVHQIVGAAFAPKLLLQCCSNDHERIALQRLGIALGIQELIKDFDAQTQRQESVMKVEQEQKQIEEDRSKDVPNDTEVNEPSLQKELELTETVPINEELQQDLAHVSPEASPCVKSDDKLGDTPLSTVETSIDGTGEEPATVEDTQVKDEDTVPGTEGPVPPCPHQIQNKEGESEGAESSVNPSRESNGKEIDDLDKQTLGEEEKRSKAVIDHILREEFGVGLNLRPEEEKMVQKQREREGRGLHRLSSELYSRDTHFVLELVQNADDNTYPDEMCGMGTVHDMQPAVVFVVTKSCVTVLNNEVGFKESHIRALCDVGRSTKGKHVKGYIGQKGIGFKSVFRVSDVPEVHSGAYHIKFNSNSGPLGYILPHWIPPSERHDYDEELKGIEGSEDARWTTKIILPLKSDLRGQIKTLAPRFHDVQPSLLLFLNRLRSISIVDKVNKTERQMQRKDLANGLIVVQHSFGVDRWLVVRRELDSSNMKHDVARTELAIGFPLPEEDVLSLKSSRHQSLPQQKVFAFLPLQSYGFRFIIQADFEVPSSREAVDESSSWNQWIREEIASLFVEEGIRRFKELPKTSPLEAFCLFARFVPVEAEIRGIFQPVARQIVQLLKAKSCMPVQGLSDPANGEGILAGSLEWAKPPEVVIARDRLAYHVLPPDILKEQLGLHYLHSEVVDVLNPALAHTLGVEDLSTHHFISVAQSVCANSSTPETNRLSIEWVAKWMVCVNRSIIYGYKSISDNINSLKKLPIVPLNNGSFVPLNETIVFFPLKETRKKGRSLGKGAATYMDNIHDDLNTVSYELLTCQSPSENDVVYQLLLDMGVRDLNPRGVIEDHIFPILESDTWQSKSAELLADYMTFIKEEMARDPKVCSLEKLKSCAVVVTDKGPVKPVEEVVHFSGEFFTVELFDLKKLFPEVKWNLADKIYLERSKALNAAQSESWVLFLEQLGVERGLALKKHSVSLTREELASTPWADEVDKFTHPPDDHYQIDDWDCPEFLAIVSSVQQLDEQVKRLRMQKLVQLLDRMWEDKFSAAISTVIRSSSGEVLQTKSSFQRQLLQTPWIPTEEKYRQRPNAKRPVVLRRPSKLFLKDNKISQLLFCHVHYVDAKLSDDLSKTLGIRTMADIEARGGPEFLMDKLQEWSASVSQDGDSVELKSFKTSLTHMSSVYHYILEMCRMGERDRLKAIRTFFREVKAIFVPIRSKLKKAPNELVAGRFFRVDEVCRGDTSTGGIFRKVQTACTDTVYVGPQLLTDAYSSLGSNRCSQLMKLFQEKLKVLPTPSTLAFVELIEYLSMSVPFPNDSVLKNMQALYVDVARKMERKAREEAWTRARKKLQELRLPSTMEEYKQEDPSRNDGSVNGILRKAKEEVLVLENEEAAIVRNFVCSSSKKLFASSKNVWVSSNTSILINDDEDISRLFEPTSSLQFLYIAREDELVAAESSQRILDRAEHNKVLAQKYYRKDNATVTELDFYNPPRKQKTEEQLLIEERAEKIHIFAECCGMRRLSMQSIIKKAVYDSPTPCASLQRYLGRVLPYIQRYLFSEHQSIYRQLLDQKLENKLQNMRCLTVERLAMVYIIEDLNVESEEQELDCMLSGEELIVTASAWREGKEHKEVNRELATMFLSPTHRQVEHFESFVSFIDSVASRLTNEKNLRKFVEQQLEKLPNKEVKWLLFIAEANWKDESAGADKGTDNETDVQTSPEPMSIPLPIPSVPTVSTRKSRCLSQQEDGTLKSWPPKSSTNLPNDKSQRKIKSDKLEPQARDEEKEEEWPMPGRPSTWKGPMKEPVARSSDQLKGMFKQHHEYDYFLGNGQRANNTEATSTLSQATDIVTENAADISHTRATENVPSLPFEHPVIQTISVLPSSTTVDLPPTVPTSVSTHVTHVQFEPVATAESLQSPRSATLSSTPSLQEIGRYGEELVYLFLQQQKELGLLQRNGIPDHNVTVIWVNEEEESGKPYDICLQYSSPDKLTQQSLFVEVKTTTSPKIGVFEISHRQIQFAHQHKHAFHLYRVFNAGQPTVQLYRVQNLVQCLDTKQAQLFMII